MQGSRRGPGQRAHHRRGLVACAAEDARAQQAKASREVRFSTCVEGEPDE